MTGSTGTPREKALEKKIVTLERRLHLVERFVELRFCESFKDFSVRNRTKGPDSVAIVDKKLSTIARSSNYRDVILEDVTMEEHLSSEEEEQEVTTYLTRSGRKSTRLTTAGMGYKASKAKTEDTSRNKVVVKECPASDVESDRDADFESLECFVTPSEHNDGGEIGINNDEHVEEEVAFEDDEDENIYEDGGNEEFKLHGKIPVRGSLRQRKKMKTELQPKGGNTLNKRPMPKSARLKMLKLSGITTKKECPLCHKHFEMDQFDEHMFSAHVSEKKYQQSYTCTQCGKVFDQQGKLTKHEKNHQLDKQSHKCRICEKGFSNKSILAHERGCIQRQLKSNQHVDPEVMEDVKRRSARFDLNWPDPSQEIPEGMKQCMHCKELVTSDNLLAHLREQHANFKCAICGKSYVHKHGLRRHMATDHADVKESSYVEGLEGENQSEGEELVEEYEEEMMDAVSITVESEAVVEIEPPS